jgi:molybdopterin synthase catalytic subunit
MGNLVARMRTATAMRTVRPPTAATPVGFTAGPLSPPHWAVLPSCGAVVLFSGPSDHAVDEGGCPHDVHSTTSVCEQATPFKDRRRAHAARHHAACSRLGRIELGESSVIAVVSAPHRPEAFEAARYAIDALKASAPIWKHETWHDGDAGAGSGWGTNAHEPTRRRCTPPPRPSGRRSCR